jgi:hypothetical protein
LVLSRKQPVGHPVPYLGEMAFRVLPARINQKPSDDANVDKTLPQSRTGMAAMTGSAISTMSVTPHYL